VLDPFTREQRSAVMRRVKGRDTGPELAVRRVLRAAGIGYRLGGAGLPGRPDLVMKGRRLVLFVHGCFWHGHDCPRGARSPKTNTSYWATKIERNRSRDAAVRSALALDGWRVITVWECALRREDFVDRLLEAIHDQAAAVSITAPS
jgi:DNA mismatch endonuclease (patch repair protein)